MKPDTDCLDFRSVKPKPKTPRGDGLGESSCSALSTEELGKLSADIDMYMDWAQVWHRQAGGYTASDTFLTMMRMETWAERLRDLTGKPETRLRQVDAEKLQTSYLRQAVPTPPKSEMSGGTSAQSEVRNRN